MEKRIKNLPIKAGNTVNSGAINKIPNAEWRIFKLFNIMLYECNGLYKKTTILACPCTTSKPYFPTPQRMNSLCGSLGIWYNQSMQSFNNPHPMSFRCFCRAQYAWLLVITLLFTSRVYGAEQSAQLTTADAERIAYSLKSNHSMAKAIYLTRIADQLSQSFASEAQLQNRWLQALDENIEPELNFSHINTHNLMAQVLINFSHGMTLNRWRMVDLTPENPPPVLTEFTTPAGQFKAWLNLSHYWQIILQRLETQGSTAWLELHNPQKVNNQALALENQLIATFTFIEKLSKASAQGKSNNINNDAILKQSLVQFSSQWQRLEPLSVMLLRQTHHQQHQLWLAWAYDWIEIYQHIELSSQLLTADEQLLFSQYIKKSQVLWTDKESIINGRDQFLYGLIQELLTQLPLKFKNPDHSDENINHNILTLATGIENPADYFSQPLRDQIQENLEVCLNLSSPQTPNPQEPIANHQLDSCLKDFILWAQQAAFDPGLAGLPASLENSINLDRVLELPPPQIINYLPAGMVKEQACIEQLGVKPNPFEWLLAVESLNWLYDRWPGIMAEHEFTTMPQGLIDSGLSIYRYPECFKTETLLTQQFNQLEQKWTAVKQAIRLHIKDFRRSQLSTNSDIDFFQNTDQTTDSVPENLTIKACDASTACGAFIELEPDSKVLQLFPNHLKLAQQFKLGQLSICYEKVQWQDRKSLPAELKNDKIARYEGQLAITLVGKYQDQTVFTQQLETVDRYIYLFAENSSDVMAMSCPLPIIGKQITTSLDRGTFGLLPNRLTFLTAQKVDVNNVIKKHWPVWQNYLRNSNYNVIDAMEPVKALVNEAFLQHSNTVQQQIYRKLTTSNPARINDSALSFAIFDYLTERQRLNATIQALFPELYQKDIDIRRTLAGNTALVDLAFFKQSFAAQLNLMDMMDQGDVLFEQHKPAWFEIKPMHNERFIQPTLVQFKQRYLKAVNKTEVSNQVP